MGDTQLFLKQNVRRLIFVLLALIAVPCALLVFLSYQNALTMRQLLIQQYRENCRLELRDIGKATYERLNDLLEANSKDLLSLSPSQPAFWDVAVAHLSDDEIVRAPLVLDVDGTLLFPPSSVPLRPQPLLSGEHPTYSTLIAARRSHWIDKDYSRAVELYEKVLQSEYIPASTKVSVWSEMAQSEQQLGHLPEVIKDCDNMLEEFRGIRSTDELAPLVLLTILRTAEISRHSAAPEQLRRWETALLDICEKHWLSLDPEQLIFMTRRLNGLIANASSDKVDQRLKRLEQLTRLRTAMVKFTRDHGIGPFQVSLHSNLDSATEIWQSPLLPPSLDDLSYILVYTGEPLPDGCRLAFDVDVNALYRQVLQPRLLKIMQTHGGTADVIRVSNSHTQIASVDDPDIINYQLSPPLEFWALQYNIKNSPLFRSPAAWQSRFQVTLLVLAATLVAAGLIVILLQINRSVQLGRLQADVVDRIGHELRTPIAAAAVLAETLARDDGEKSATQKQVAGLLHGETQSLMRLSERLLSYAHLRAGAARLHMAEHRLDRIMAEIVRLFIVEAGVDASCITLEIEPADYLALFDRGAIEEIVRNLLDNAIKYCDGPPQVRVTLSRVDRQCILKVLDKGWGIDERIQQRVFQPYFRGDASLNAKVPGIGLGLTIVSSLVRAHGGTVILSSSPSQGSVFEIHLPLNMGDLHRA